MTFLDLFCLTFPFWRSFPAIQSYLIHIVPANERNLLYPDLHPSHAFSGEKVKGSLQCTSTVHQTTGSDTCPRSFDNCQPALTLSLPEDELKCKSEVVETAGSSSLSPRFHSWRDSPWGGHQVVFLDGVLRVLTHCCFNSWGKGGRGGLGWPYVCCHRVISTVGALSRPSNGDNRPSIPSHPVHPTYRSECSKPFYADLKQIQIDRGRPDQMKSQMTRNLK